MVAPIKCAASIQIIFFGPMYYGAFAQKIVHANIVAIDKIHSIIPILGHFKAASMQERPLMARVR